MFRGIDFNVPNLFSDVTIPSVSVIELLNRFAFVILKTFDVRGRSGWQFRKWLFGPEDFSGLSRIGQVNTGYQS